MAACTLVTSRTQAASQSGTSDQRNPVLDLCICPAGTWRAPHLQARPLNQTRGLCRRSWQCHPAAWCRWSPLSSPISLRSPSGSPPAARWWQAGRASSLWCTLPQAAPSSMTVTCWGRKGWTERRRGRSACHLPSSGLPSTGCAAVDSEPAFQLCRVGPSTPVLAQHYTLVQCLRIACSQNSRCACMQLHGKKLSRLCHHR